MGHHEKNLKVSLCLYGRQSIHSMVCNIFRHNGNGLHIQPPSRSKTFCAQINRPYEWESGSCGLLTGVTEAVSVTSTQRTHTHTKPSSSGLVCS